MLREEPRIRARHDFTGDEIDALEDRLAEFNQTRMDRGDAARIGFAAESDGELVGAVAGYTWGGICELRQVWVHEAYRGRGLGRSLMTQAIAEARGRGCARVFLATHSFQAPDFYRRLGFAAVAEVIDKPIGHKEIVMRLVLDGNGEV
jgi:N-acetylglutamate synthase-like GNAT family acetyltransferase